MKQTDYFELSQKKMTSQKKGKNLMKGGLFLLIFHAHTMVFLFQKLNRDFFLSIHHMEHVKLVMDLVRNTSLAQNHVKAVMALVYAQKLSMYFLVVQIKRSEKILLT